MNTEHMVMAAVGAAALIVIGGAIPVETSGPYASGGSDNAERSYLNVVVDILEYEVDQYSNFDLVLMKLSIENLADATLDRVNIKLGGDIWTEYNHDTYEEVRAYDGDVSVNDCASHGRFTDIPPGTIAETTVCIIIDKTFEPDALQIYGDVVGSGNWPTQVIPFRAEAPFCFVTWYDHCNTNNIQRVNRVPEPLEPEPEPEPINLAYSNLAGEYLAGADLTGANLRYANLTGADLRDIVLLGADLTGADLTGTNLHNAILIDANLRYAHLSSANLTGAHLSDTRMSNADLTLANMTLANLRGADLFGANLRGADLFGANLPLVNLRSADLRDADLHYANLWTADLNGADLRDTSMVQATLDSADLTNADLRGADLTNADLRGADLTNADLRGADLTGVLRD